MVLALNKFDLVKEFRYCKVSDMELTQTGAEPTLIFTTMNISHNYQSPVVFALLAPRQQLHIQTLQMYHICEFRSYIRAKALLFFIQCSQTGIVQPFLGPSRLQIMKPRNPTRQQKHSVSQKIPLYSPREGDLAYPRREAARKAVLFAHEICVGV